MKLNQINWKKVLRVFLWSQALLLLGVMLGYVNHAESLQKCTALDIQIDNEPSGVYFIDKQDVITMLNDRAMYPVGVPAQVVNTHAIEALFDDDPYVFNAEVFMNVKGKLNIEVKQRKAIMRVINFKGEKFYIDSVGALMPMSDQYVARVPVATGSIAGSLLFTKIKPFLNTEDSATASRHDLMDSLFVLADYIAKDEVLSALVEQVYVNADHEFELIPLIGGQKILFGGIEDMEDKFSRLLVFYQKGLVRRGWDAYATINLKYRDQIVCTQLETVASSNTNPSNLTTH